MRMPWVPRVQSRGCEAEVKLVRSVMDVERVGSSAREMGGKRWSSIALHVHMMRQLLCRYCHMFCSLAGGTCDLRSQSIHPESSRQLLCFKRANASPEILVPTPRRYRVPCHEQGMLFFFGRGGR